MDGRLEQYWKALFWILVMLLGKVTEVRPLQALNVYSSIVVMLLGISMEVNPVQLEKAYVPILVTEEIITL